MKEVGWIVCLVSNWKKRVPLNWTCGINFKCCCCVVFFLISFLPAIFFSSPTSELVSCRASRRLKNALVSCAFRQDLNNGTKIQHPGQSHNVVIYMCASTWVALKSNTIYDWEDVNLIAPVTRFSLPDLVLHTRHIRARFELTCTISLTTKM